MKIRAARYCLLAGISCLGVGDVWALDPHKALTQFTRTIWTQKDGLPQDLVKAITQTTDGYLWLATDEGLARFDGYDFTQFTRDGGNLPTNSVTALAASKDGSLWIGTANGLAHYDGKRFLLFTTKEGLPDNSISDVFVDHAGIVWIFAGGSVARLENGAFKVFRAGRDIPFAVRTMYEDRHNVLWVAGFGGLAEWTNGKFISRVSAPMLSGNLFTSLVGDDQDNLWMAGGNGVLRRSPDGTIRKFDTSDGLPDKFVRSLRVDHNGSLWVGTNAGLARLGKNGFVALSGDDTGDVNVTWCLFEDREGNLWAGANNGLSRFRDDIFTPYGQKEGLPGDDPNTVFQDHRGRIWVGFHNSGLMLFSADGAHNQLFNIRNGLPSNEIFAIRETRQGNLLMGTRGGVVQMNGSQFNVYRPQDELGRTLVLDAMEDSAGKLWLATQSGLGQLQGDQFRIIVPGGPLLVDLVVTLAEGKDGVLWAGTSAKGLWRIAGEDKRQFTTRDGLSSDQIYSLYPDPAGTVWIATFGGGLNAFRDGKFVHFTALDGLLSDNISHVTDDGESLWLSTTRGVCRISKQQLADFSEHRITKLQPTNYGVNDGLRSAQLALGYMAAGGTRTSDGRIWFPTTRGLAMIDPNLAKRAGLPPVLMMDAAVDGKSLDFSQPVRLAPRSERIRIRYAAIHLSAPERVQYSYKLEGLDEDWVQAGRRREINYNTLPHGQYRFLVKAEVSDGVTAEQAYAFEVLPKFHETTWFRLLSATALLGAILGIYQLRLQRLRYWFTVVMEERTRLAREIHDTLAQGFIGISSQLDGVAMALPEDISSARRDLDLARKMARYCITEARRSVLDLRASVLEGQNLGAALNAGAQIWTAGSGVKVEVDVSGTEATIPDDVERNLLRIAQEAVTNGVKHAGASNIWVKLQMIEPRKLYLGITDDGRGFEHGDVFVWNGGHFGLIGMRERAQRLGGELRLASQPGRGTKIEVTVSLP